MRLVAFLSTLALCVSSVSGFTFKILNQTAVANPKSEAYTDRFLAACNTTNATIWKSGIMPAPPAQGNALFPPLACLNIGDTSVAMRCGTGDGLGAGLAFAYYPVRDCPETPAGQDSRASWAFSYGSQVNTTFCVDWGFDIFTVAWGVPKSGNMSNIAVQVDCSPNSPTAAPTPGATTAPPTTQAPATTTAPPTTQAPAGNGTTQAPTQAPSGTGGKGTASTLSAVTAGMVALLVSIQQMLA